MNLEEMKKRVLSLIEEINPNSQYLTDDEDIQAKINYVIDAKNVELARIKKIAAIETMDVEEDMQVDLKEQYSDFMRLQGITGVDFEIFETIVTFKEEGTATIKYYKFPTKITASTPNTYTFENTMDVLDIMPYGIAADLLKNDASTQFGAVYSSAYNSALQMLDIRNSEGTIRIVGGF